MSSTRLFSSFALIAALAAAPAGAQTWNPNASPDVVARAKAIHDRVIALDTHNDISPVNFTAEKNYTKELDTQVNLPKMIKGGLDASFFIVYVGQPNPATTPGALTKAGYDRAYASAVEKFDAVHRLTEVIAPDKIELALTAADVRRIAASGKKVALIGIENGYPIGEDVSRVKEFYDRGGRYLSLAHNGNNQLSDSNTGERDGYKWDNGISPLGRQVITEANKWGIMVDVSHPSKGSMLEAARFSAAPIIASHSAVRVLCNVPRNMDDEMLQALKKNGGVIQMVAFASYIKTPKPDSPERAAALTALRKQFNLPEPAAGGGGGGGRGNNPLDQLAPDRRAEYDKQLAAINAKTPADPRATVGDFVDHIDYAVKLIGIDHIGISSDFDGGGGITGWSDASETFNVTLELVKRGYTEEQIGKMWSGNLLRVMEETAKVAARLQAAK